MTNEISQVSNPSVTFATMISEAVYRTVVGAERLMRLFGGASR